MTITQNVMHLCRILGIDIDLQSKLKGNSENACMDSHVQTSGQPSTSGVGGSMESELECLEPEDLEVSVFMIHIQFTK